MFAPTRLFYAARTRADAGLLAAAAAVAVLFAATPFIVEPLAEQYGIPLGRAGLLSTAQVGGFALAAFVAGRRFRTHRAYLTGAALAAVILNLVSIVIPWFEVLLVVRALAGAAAGVLVWLSWAKAMQSTGAMREVAALGPLTVVVAAPIISFIAERGGADAVFALLALSYVPSAVLPARFAGFRAERRRLSPSRSNVVLILALGIDTLAGSSLWVFTAAVGASLGIASAPIALGFSANAIAGWAAARRHAGDEPEAFWIFMMAAAAGAVVFGASAPFFFAGIILWGFAFWMSTPPILRAIAAWSLVPEERVGDAQSTMAVGRALGPAVGSMLVGSGRFGLLGWFAVGGLTVSGLIVLAVRIYRRSHLPPRGAVAASPIADAAG